MTKRQYVEYLIATCSNYTCMNLPEPLEGAPGTSHDVIGDFLKGSKLTPRQLCKVVAPLIDDTEESYLVLDDSVQNKQYSKHIEPVKLQYGGAEHGLIRGIDIVNLIHTDGKEDGYYPIDFRNYGPASDGKTKNDHFQETLVRAVSESESRQCQLSRYAMA